MQITNIRIRRVQGVMEQPEPLWEERLIRPVDLYPEDQAVGPEYYKMPEIAPHRYAISTFFLELDTDEGVTGRAGPLREETAYLVHKLLKPLLLRADPIANEKLWDRMYRTAIHGRKGEAMMAISAVDCALWDLRGKWLNVPVYRLLGGPTRERIRVYASALGYSLDPALVRERAQRLVAEGYTAMKWFFRWGPWNGREGMRKNLELASTLREAVGPEVDIMLDAWSSWDVPYAIQMAEQLAAYDIFWLEEPVLADKLDSYAAIRAVSPIRIAGGEHEYTRWGFKEVMALNAMDVWQPDIYWAGGISELLKICTLASVADVIIIPHGHSTPANAHLTLSQSPALIPIQEYLLKWNEIHQFFLKHPLKPVNGYLSLPELPGLGMELDEEKIEQSEEMQWL
ncbi:MAG: mandelate racemase/muconate lactonizing protein [Nitrospinota bacterium]|nr:MAG: mandelate racemase/muconate lactonizing protein [Nitrospinota bacterium]